MHSNPSKRLASLSIVPVVVLLAACAANKTERAKPPIIDCCADFDIDLNLVLGPKAANCGTINSRGRTLSERRKNRAAVVCVRDAQARGRALVVNQGYSSFPDYALNNIVVFGAQGEKILVVIEYLHDGPTVFAGPCDVLKVLDNGDLEYSGCRTDDALLERMSKSPSHAGG